MKFILTFLVFLNMMMPQLAKAAGEGIAAVVNSEAITNSDVDARIHLIAASTGMPQTPEIMAKLRPQVVDMLVDETLKSQEARRLKVNVTPEEIEQGFAEIAGNNNVSVDKFKGMIEKSGIDPATMQDQIRTQIAWGKVVQRQVRSRIEVSDSDIDTELDKFKTKLGQTQYHISEIFVPVTNPKNFDAALDFVNKVAGQLRQQPEAFSKAAEQVSRAPDAKKGGDMGWMDRSQLPPEFLTLVDTLPENQLSDPIKTMTGYYLIVLREKREITAAMTPKREELLQKIGTQRLERGARRYILDLRSSAFIEIRNQA